MAENDAPERVWVQMYHNNIAAYNRDPREVHDNGKPVYIYTRADLAAPDAAQIGKLLDAWELLPNDVKSDLKREFPSFTDSITSLFQSTESGDYEQ